MPRGGARQGTPGKAYGNRTDMMSNYSAGSASQGQLTPDPSAAAVTPASQPQPTPSPMQGMFPEDTPMLTDPTAFPDEPITAGLPMGAGAGPQDARSGSWDVLKRKLPDLKVASQWEDTPVEFKALVRYLENK